MNDETRATRRERRLAPKPRRRGIGGILSPCLSAVVGGEEAVEFDNIEAFGHVNEGIYVSQLNAPLATWTGLNVHDNGQTGVARIGN